MKDFPVSITLTKEEIKDIEYLSPEEKEKYGMDAVLKRVSLMAEMAALITRILEIFDELEKMGTIRSKIKVASKAFLIQINGYINNVFKGGDDPIYGNDWINDKLTKMAKIFK